jgi:predicted membrane metal-binding protein
MLPILYISLAYIIGVIWGLYLNFNLGIAFFCLLLCLYVFFIKKKCIFILMILFIFLLSLFYANYRDGVYKNKYINKDNVMLCKVISDLVEEEFYNTYTVKLKCGDKMLLYMDRNALKLEYGTQVLVEGYIELPKGKRNFGGFDFIVTKSILILILL